MQVLVSSPRLDAAEPWRDLILDVDPASVVRLDIRVPGQSGTQPIEPTLDLILLDVDEPGPYGEKLLISGFRKDQPGAHIVAVGSRDDDGYVKNILELGISGYLPGTYSRTVLLGMLRLVLSGRPVTPARDNAGARHINFNATNDKEMPSLGDYRLTARKIEVLRLISEGLPNQEIARRLDITEGTTKLHVSAIYRELGVRNRAEAALIASRMRGLDATQLADPDGGNLDLNWLLPHMLHRHVARGTILFHKGDKGIEFAYVQRGTVRLEEIDVDLGEGSVFGEIGIFSPLHQRTCTAKCKTDVELFTLASDQVKRLYLQNPRFAFYLVHLIARRLMADQARVV